MVENFESKKQNETQGKLTAIPDSCPSGSKTNILIVLTKPELIPIWLTVGLFIYRVVLISLFLMGKLPQAVVVQALKLG